jgi:hypothetical protein
MTCPPRRTAAKATQAPETEERHIFVYEDPATLARTARVFRMALARQAAAAGVGGPAAGPARDGERVQ